MPKILIVEDEPYERMGLKAQVAEKFGWDNVKAAGSVEEAVDIVNRWQPGLILLDIRLRGKSGFEVARYVKKEYPETKIIIITAYNEFEYARTAITFRISHYLSKPVRPSLLMDTIEEALYNNNDSAETVSRPVWPLLEAGQYKEAQKRIGFDVRTILVAGFERDDGGLENYEEYIFKYFDSEKRKLELKDSRCIIYLERNFSHLAAMLCKLCSDFQKRFCCQMVLGAGLSEGGIADCYSKAVSACNHKIFYPKESVLEFESIERQREDVYAYPVTMEQRLMNLIRRGSAAEVDDVLNKLVIELIASSGKSYPVLRTWVEGLYNSLKRMCISEGIIPNGISLIKHDFFWFSAEHLTKDTADFIGDIVRLLEGRSRINNPVIAKAVDHMLQNYKQEITLAGMAEAFNISPGYFSRLFKEETGVSFKNYLIGIRMEKAKALLLKSDAVISETAWEVGYSDPNYFSEAFRKFEGMSPSEYREANGIP